MDERIGREVYVTKNHGTSPNGVQRVRVEQIVGVLAAAEAALMMRKPVIMFLLIKPVTQRTLKANTHEI